MAAMQAPQRVRSQLHVAHKSGDPHLLVPLTIAVWDEDGKWLSECLEFGIGSFGTTPDDAAEQAMDAICSYLNTIEELGERERVFAEKSIVTYVASPAELRLPRLSRELAQRKGLQLRPYEYPIAFA